MPLDHLALAVPPAHFEAVLAQYLAALAPLGYKEKVRPVHDAVGLWADGHVNADFWIASYGVTEDDPIVEAAERFQRGENVRGLHFAFAAKENALVDAAYEAAIKAGAVDNGKPGYRPHYTENYYGAFWKDPLGNNVEVVSRKGS